MVGHLGTRRLLKLAPRPTPGEDEKRMRDVFGAEFEAYARQVRRWGVGRDDERRTNAPMDFRIKEALLNRGVILLSDPAPGARLACEADGDLPSEPRDNHGPNRPDDLPKKGRNVTFGSGFRREPVLARPVRCDE